MFLSFIAGESETKPKPITRKEKLLDKIGVSGGGGGAKPEQEKTVNITENGTTEVIPDEGNTLSKVIVNTSVAAGGEPGKPYIDTSKITNFRYYFAYGRGSDNDLIANTDFSNGTNFNDAFYDNEFITIAKVNSEKGIYFGRTFQSCNQAKEISINISNGTNFDSTFYGCAYLETVSLTTPKSNLSSNTFYNCTALKNLTIGEGWAVNIYLHYSNNLTVESLHGMIENLADLTGQTAKTFQIGETNLAKIDEDHMAMLNAKNWNYS